MVNLSKKETITIGPPARCARHDITLLGYIKTNVMTLGKGSNHHIWPRFRSDWCQDNSHSGCLRRKVQHKLSRWHCNILENWTMEASSEQGFIITSRRGEEVTDWLSDNPLRFPKDGFPQLCEQGDNICQIKWYNDVCSRKTYTIKHWLKGAPEIWVGLHDQC